MPMVDTNQSDSPLQTDFLDMVDEPMGDSNPKDPRAAATVSVVQPMGGAAFKLGHGVRSPVQDPSSSSTGPFVLPDGDELDPTLTQRVVVTLRVAIAPLQMLKSGGET